MKHVIEGCLIKYDTLMFDGRKIMSGAFKDNDGSKIPVCLSFSLCADDTIGYATLKDKEDGIYYIAKINLPDENDSIIIDKIIKDGYRFGMFANQLKEKDRTVEYGIIRRIAFTAPCDSAGCVLKIDGDSVIYNKDIVQLKKRVSEKSYQNR